MRTEKSIKNLKYSFLGQIFAIFISLITRKIFIDSLNSEYLGINGLFTNILTILSLVELGIGPAITFSLYKPLKENSVDKIKALMSFFKKCYIIIGVTILILGMSITPFLSYLISDLPNINNLNLIYCLFVFNSAISYFWSYKKILLTSDQQGYVVSKYHYILYFIMNMLQIILLVITNNYILYLIIQILFTLLENILISFYVNKKYPFLKEKNIDKIEIRTKKEITKNIKAMIMHKFGSIIVTATDNLIISKYVGVVAVGLYSNYYLIINNIHKILKQTFNAVIASVGNLGAENNKSKLIQIFNRINFINYYIQSLCSIIMLIVFQDFISLWVGADYLFSFDIVFVLVLNFYFTGLRTSVLLFKDALGLYWQDRYKALVEAIINLVASIYLANKFGVIGVFIGTLISTLTTCFWLEPHILYKYGFNQKSSSYFTKIFSKTVVAFLSCIVCLIICKYIKYSYILNFVFKTVISFVIINVIYYVIYHKTDEYNYLKTLMLKILKNKR